MCTMCYPSAVIHRRQNKVLGIEVYVALDPDSRRTEIAANAALPVATRNGLSEDCIGSSTWCKINSSVSPKYSAIEFTVFERDCEKEWQHAYSRMCL